MSMVKGASGIGSWGTVGWVLLTALLGVTGCRSHPGGASSGSGQGALAVVTTVGMIADMARIIGGECVAVEALMGPGVDPHVYRASASDVEALRGADVILFGGLMLEGRMSDVLERLSERQPTLAVLEQVDRERLLASPNFGGHPDPHLWMDASLWAQAVPSVLALLSEHRPDCAESMRANAEAYRAELSALHAWVADTMATIPQTQRVLVTAHDAFSYYGRAYGVEVVGIQGVSTESEAGVNDIQTVARLIVDRRVPALFVESSVNPRNIEAVRAAVEAAGWQVAMGRSLFSDAMGEAGTWQGTYIGMIRSNALAIADALGGQPAAWPVGLATWAARWGLT